MGKVTPLHLLVFEPADDGCTWYRQRMFTFGAKDRDDIEIITVTKDASEQQIEGYMEWADVFYVRAAQANLAKFMQFWRLKYPKLAIVADTDDDLFNVHPFNNSSYVSAGTSEVIEPKGNTWIYRDLVNGFDSLSNMKTQAEYGFVVNRADAVTVTTQRLAATLKPFQQHVLVIPNAISEYWLPRVSLPKGDKVKILWSGGSSHHRDLWMVAEELKSLLERNKNVELHFCGQKFPWYDKTFPKGQFFYHPWVKADGQGYRLAFLNADIGICPLEDIEFNTFKSCVKWYEYSAVGMATVASDVAPYSDEIEHNKTGMLAKTPEQFATYLQDLINDPLKRAALARDAYSWVTKHRHINKVIDDWVAVLRAASEHRLQTVEQQPKEQDAD